MVIATEGFTNCPMDCAYCFTKGIPYKPLDLNKVLSTLERLAKAYPTEEIILHGSEPTFWPKPVFRKMLETVYRLRGHTSIQTSGFGITDWHIRMFKKYNTSIGLSVDGPPPCNILRGRGSIEERYKMSERLQHTIEKLVKAKLRVSMIIIIHRLNGIVYREQFYPWLLWLKSLGICSGRLNPCNVKGNNPAKQYELSPQEAVDVYTSLYKFCKAHGLSYSPFRDIANSLLGNLDQVVCVFRGCDPYNTPSITCVGYQGEELNCIKLYKRETYPKARDRRVDIRTSLLAETDCQGCQWFPYCNGGCPAHGLNDDWRRKDRFCEVWKALFELISKELEAMGIPRKPVGPPSPQSLGSKGHTDGIEHIDGNWRHLDGYR